MLQSGCVSIPDKADLFLLQSCAMDEFIAFFDFECKALHYLNMVSSQLHPNNWAFVRAFQVLCGCLEVDVSLNKFLHFYQLKLGTPIDWVLLSGLNTGLFSLYLGSYKFKNEFMRMDSVDRRLDFDVFFEVNGKPKFLFYWQEKPRKFKGTKGRVVTTEEEVVEVAIEVTPLATIVAKGHIVAEDMDPPIQTTSDFQIDITTSTSLLVASLIPGVADVVPTRVADHDLEQSTFLVNMVGVYSHTSSKKTMYRRFSGRADENEMERLEHGSASKDIRSLWSVGIKASGCFKVEEVSPANILLLGRVGYAMCKRSSDFIAKTTKKRELTISRIANLEERLASLQKQFEELTFGLDEFAFDTLEKKLMFGLNGWEAFQVGETFLPPSSCNLSRSSLRATSFFLLVIMCSPWSGFFEFNWDSGIGAIDKFVWRVLCSELRGVVVAYRILRSSSTYNVLAQSSFGLIQYDLVCCFHLAIGLGVFNRCHKVLDSELVEECLDVGIYELSPVIRDYCVGYRVKGGLVSLVVELLAFAAFVNEVLAIAKYSWPIKTSSEDLGSHMSGPIVESVDPFGRHTSFDSRLAHEFSSLATCFIAPTSRASFKPTIRASYSVYLFEVRNSKLIDFSMVRLFGPSRRIPTPPPLLLDEPSMNIVHLSTPRYLGCRVISVMKLLRYCDLIGSRGSLYSDSSTNHAVILPRASSASST
ncbi:hypothetical protein VNO78_34376 [Psophocarpus tetragonolobus]|uniref:Uncharacterized protein n=1 Tax=Psophocarpus tetragonolobus TaxID=3891 RepID=A0AAN9NZ09_PSOTE